MHGALRFFLAYTYLCVYIHRMNSIQKKLIADGVDNVKGFGYPSCDKTNILTDIIYSKFLLYMLKKKRGRGFDKDIDGLIDLINAAK